MTRSIRLAIVDDALFIREGLKRLLSGQANITVVGTAASGEELLENLDAWRPDVVTLDLNMPGMGGLATLEKLMTSHPLPVIVLSTHSGAGAPMTVEALARGAVDFIDKEAYSLVDFEALRAVLVEKISGVAGRSRTLNADAARPRLHRDAKLPLDAFDILVIGASTGGPRAVESVLRALGDDVPCPVAVVQHMPPGFTRAFAERLDRALPLTVREAVEGDVLEAGAVYVAPGGRHMALHGQDGGARVALPEPTGTPLHTPSVDELFASAGRAFGERVLAVLLTGMGKDGAAGMDALRKGGAHTIAQSEETCVVFGMPRAAIEHGAAAEILPLASIGPRLRELLSGGEPHLEN